MAEVDQLQRARPTVPTNTGPMNTAPTTGELPLEGKGAPAPSVLAVVVTHDPGPHLEETLRSLAGQDYPRLSVLVVDAASAEDPSERVTALLPEATVVRREDDRGFGAAANTVLDDGARAALYLFCHDDVALRPDAISRLVEEVVRSNAAIVGPKVVEWDAPARLQNVGLAVDKFGVSAPIVEPGELDQEQHDAVTDVFAVSGGCTMVRADLFRTIGGYDEGISFRGDDVDLCWRAQLAGARVMVVPAAVVRHHEQLSERRGIDDVRRLRMRHQLRTLLSCSSPGRLVRLVPQAMLLALGEIILALLRGRVSQARDVASAWAWNLRRLPSIHRRRKKVHEFRQVSDAELHRMQVRGSVRLRAFLRGQIGRHDGVGGLAASGRTLATSLKSADTRDAVTALAILSLVLLVGSRHLLTRSIPAVGELQPLMGGTGDLLADWWRGWHTRAMGTSAAAPTAQAMLGLAGIPLLGHAALLRTLLVLVPLPLAGVGVWRFVRPFGSRRAAVVGTVVYLANPIPYNALARGSFSALVAYATAPWLFAQLARSLEARPFVRSSRRGGSVAHRALGTGFLVAVIAAFVPWAIILMWIVVVGLVVGSLVAGDGRGVPRLMGVTAGATAIAFVLHAPWTFTFLRDNPTWSSFVGQGASAGNGLRVGDLLRFHTGPVGGTIIGFGTVVAAAFALVLAHGARFAWAVRCWFVAIAAFGAVWAGEQGWFDRPLPEPGVTLAIAAFALAVSAALAVVALESDLRRHRFGWRQLAAGTAVLSLAAAALPLLAAAADGRWNMPDRGFTSTFDTLASSPDEGPGRVLWIGDQGVLPITGFELGQGAAEATVAGNTTSLADDGYDRLAVATTDDGGPTFTDRWGGPETTGVPGLSAALDTAVGGNTSRLGRLLAPYAIRYVVIVEGAAPGAGIDHPVPASLPRALGAQLDLEPVQGVSDEISVYRNLSWAPMRFLLPPPPNVDTDVTTLPEIARTDLAGLSPVLTESDDGIAAEGPVPDDRDVYVAATAAPDWHLEVNGNEVARRDAFGWANAFAIDGAGDASLRYDTPMRRHLLLGAQVLLWIGAWFLLGNLRHRRSATRPVRGTHAKRQDDDVAPRVPDQVGVR
jgi:GT2 family glycosyltransferase